LVFIPVRRDRGHAGDARHRQGPDDAGAGRISSLRREAAKREFDPNVWFQNVAYVAAEKIGQETVTDVSNIYKYYIAYRLVLESRAAQKESVE
jgi:membrane-bound lytic murein transglycosylase MltF